MIIRGNYFFFQLRGCIFRPCIHNSAKELYSDITQPRMVNMQFASHFSAHMSVRTCVLSCFSRVQLHPWNFPGKNTEVSCHFLLQGIFPTQGPNPGLPHCRQMLYYLSYQRSPSLQHYGPQPVRLLCPLDSPGKNAGVGCHFLLQGTSQPRDQTSLLFTHSPTNPAEPPGQVWTQPSETFNMSIAAPSRPYEPGLYMNCRLSILVLAHTHLQVKNYLILPCTY